MIAVFVPFDLPFTNPSTFHVRGHPFMTSTLAILRERCVFHVDRVWMSTRGRGFRPMWTHVDRGGGSKTWFFV